jgi:hypothetical protein
VTGPRPRTAGLVAAAAAGVAILAWLGLTGFAWNDYDAEAAPAFAALSRGDWQGFLALAPSYGGSLLLRAPAALLADGLGGGELAIYRAVSLPGLVAAALLGVVLATRASRDRWLVLALCAANPVTLSALEIGHPEEPLGAALCVAAVLAALGRRAGWAGVLLGLAIATKAWGVLAAGPVLLALPGWGLRARAGAAAAAVAALLVGPVLLAGSGATTMVVGGGMTGGTIFQPWQVFWWLGEPGQVVLGGDGMPKPDGWRTPPAWLSPLTHPLIAFLVIPASLAWTRLRGRAPHDALLLLALLFLARCALDPWNTAYYAIPLLFSLVAWEAVARPHRPPVLALSATALTWATFAWAPLVLSPDLQSVAYLAWALPLGAGLVRAALGGSPRPAPQLRLKSAAAAA